MRANLSGISSHGRVVSLSAGGCAIRTSERLKKNSRYVIEIPDLLEVPAEVVWETNDYCIDTLYRYGLRFVKPISQSRLEQLLEDANRLPL